MDAIKRFFAAPHFDDPQKNLTASLLNFITISYFVVSVAVTSLGFLASTDLAETLRTALFLLAPLVVVFIVAQILMRMGYVRAASIFFAVGHWFSVTWGAYVGGGVEAPGLFNYLLSILIFGLLLGSRPAVGGALLSFISAVVLFIMGNRGMLPETVLPRTDIAIVFTFLVQTLLITALLSLYLRRLGDVIGQLQNTNLILAKSGADLEQRIAERTAAMEQTNLYLALATEIGQNVAQVRELNAMLRDAAEIIRAFFGMYYVQVYLTNPAQTELVLQFGTGEVGVELLSRHHRLPLDDGSINGRAAVTKRSVVIADTSTSATFRPNPLLPNTRSEMAVPLLVGDQLVGVLDMQSEQPNALNESALIAFEPLSGQIAVAIQNTRLLAEAQQARSELEALARRLARTGWDEYLDALHKPEVTGYFYDKEQVTSITEASAATSTAIADSAISADIRVGGERLGALVVEAEPGQNTRAAELVNSVAHQVSQQIENLRLLESADRYRGEAEQAMRRLTRQGWEAAQLQKAADGFMYHNHQVQPLSESPDVENVQVLPLLVRNEAIGEISVAGGEDLSTEDKELLDSVRQQLAAHLENLRLSQETQTALTQTEALYAASAQVTRATNINEVLRSVVEQTDLRSFDYGSISLFDRPWSEQAKPSTVTLVAAWDIQHLVNATIGSTYPLSPVTSVVSLLEHGYYLYVPDIETDTSWDDATRTMLRQYGRSLISYRLVAGEQWFGTLSVISRQPTDLSPDDLRQIESLVGQAATVIQSIRLLDDATARARREQSLRQITTRVRTFVEPDMILRTAARELGDALGRKVTIQLGSGQPNVSNSEPEQVA
jgi:GAF domain-containing protein